MMFRIMEVLGLSEKPERKNKKRRKMKKKGSVLIFLGVLCIIAAMALFLYNMYADKTAGDASDNILSSLENTMDDNSDAWKGTTVDPDDAADMSLPSAEIDGIKYIGRLTVPDLGLKLPVAAEWSYKTLKKSPCVYTGSVYTGDLVICAHNYARHFRRLKSLKQGAKVVFTDLDGNDYTYKVTSLETVMPKAIDTMITGDDWDLTLFTCTIGGRTRIAVRCERIDE